MAKLRFFLRLGCMAMVVCGRDATRSRTRRTLAFRLPTPPPPTSNAPTLLPPFFVLCLFSLVTMKASAAPARPVMGGSNALFGELSKGLAVTSGLKKASTCTFRYYVGRYRYEK